MSNVEPLADFLDRLEASIGKGPWAEMDQERLKMFLPNVKEIYLSSSGEDIQAALLSIARERIVRKVRNRLDGRPEGEKELQWPI